ncbi:MAG TPA: TetR/AcrR family transcriptional regulator C-terminal domain-containing protein [Pseudonocardiaceae bacterium]
MDEIVRPASRRERPAKPALTRAGIVGTALSLMRGEGVERVTMRRLAKELDTGPASLYVYVRDTDELHAAVLDELIAEVDLSQVGADGPWRDRLFAVLSSYSTLLYQHPSLARAAVVTRPSGSHYLALLDALMQLLIQGEVPADRAAWAVDLLLQLYTTNAAEHGTRNLNAPAKRKDFAELSTAIRTAPAGTFPAVAQYAEELLSGTGWERSRWRFEVLIAGILATPRP